MSDVANQEVSTDQATGSQRNGNSIARVIVMILAPCLVSAAFAMRDSAAPALTLEQNRPALVFETYMLHEGPDPIAPQPLLTPWFDFRNNGAETVTIKELSPSCGCLSPEITAKEIPPGGTGRLTLPIKTRNEAAGLREYMVTVKYEDPTPREVALTYKVVLPEKQLEIEPRVLMMMGRISSADHSIISIADYRPERLQSPMKIQKIVSSSSLFSARVIGNTSNDGVSRTAIEVTFTDDIPGGQHRGIVTATTDDETYPVIQIPVILGDRKRAEDDPVTVNPTSGRVLVATSNPSKSTGTTIAFTVPSRWKVTHVETFPTQLTGKIEKSSEFTADQTLVEVSLSLTELPEAGIEQANLTLHATDGDQPEMVTVPITLIWR